MGQSFKPVASTCHGQSVRWSLIQWRGDTVERGRCGDSGEGTWWSVIQWGWGGGVAGARRTNLAPRVADADRFFKQIVAHERALKHSFRRFVGRARRCHGARRCGTVRAVGGCACGRVTCAAKRLQMSLSFYTLPRLSGHIPASPHVHDARVVHACRMHAHR